MREKQISEFDSAFRQMFAGFRAYIGLFIGLFLLYLFVSPFVVLQGNSNAFSPSATPYDGDVNVMHAMLLLLLLLAGTAAFLLIRRRLTAGRAVVLLIAAGFILRIGYMLYTPFFIRGHDIQSYNGYGHLAYIYGLLTRRSLPASYLGQFYHPPFAHMAEAAVAGIYAIITGATDPDTVFEASRLVPCFASCALLVLSTRLLDELQFTKRAKTVAITVIAFHPTFILLSSSINNDMLMNLFFMAAFLYTIRWYRNPCYKNIILLALAIGSAMSTKFSGGLIAVFTAMIFLIALARRMGDGGVRDLTAQFSAFAAVCLPLGLWYYIRNMRLFGQSLGYVPKMSVKSTLYIGDKPFVQRFLTFSLPDVLSSIYCQPFGDYRLWEYTIKCALFGEFTFSSKHHVSAEVLIVSSLLLVALSLAAMVRFVLFDRKRNRTAVLSFAFVWALLMVSFVYFNIKYPFGCTMDFRYIVPTVVTGAAFLGLLADKLEGSRVKNGLFTSFCAVLAVFSLASAGFYTI